MNLRSIIQKKIFKNKILNFIIFSILFIFLTEILLRLIGFGQPLIYTNNNNYYPSSNQEVKRYKGAIIKINKFGMRTNNIWEENNASNKFLFFGDSVTFGGSYIDNKDLFSEKLCLLIKKSICGNYGVNGYQIKNLNLRINSVSKDLNFNKLIIVVSSSIQNKKSIFYNFPFYNNFDYKVFKSIAEILNHILFKYEIVDNYHNNKIIKNYKDNIINDSIFYTLNKLKQKKIDIYIYIIPTLENLESNLNKKHYFEKLEFVDFKVFNIFEQIKHSNNYKQLYYNNAQLNKKGHDYLAKIIYENLR